MTLPQANIEVDEIDLKPIEDITAFSDNEKVSVEHTNFEFKQSHKLRGMLRHLTVFNDTQCYQKIKHKHRRKYKFRINLAYLDPRPYRIRHIVWKWLFASVVLWVLDAGLLITDKLVELGPPIFFGIITITTVAALLTLLAFFYLSHDTVYFRSKFGKIRLLELENNNPDKKSFRVFVNKIVVQINKSKTSMGMNQSQLLAAELKELRRLKDEAIVPTKTYEKVKTRILKHGGFKSAG
jgi:hypothetical protein